MMEVTMRVIVIVGTHLPKGRSVEESYWKLHTRLDPNKTGVGKAVAEHLADTRPTRCFHSEGFARTRESVQILTRMQSTPCPEISPYAFYNDSAWWDVDPEGDKQASQILIEHPDFCKRIGSIGGEGIRRHLAEAGDGDILLFMTHRGVAEPIVDNLLEGSGIDRIIENFGQGDLMIIVYEDGKVVEVEYFAPPKAA